MGKKQVDRERRSQMLMNDPIPRVVFKMAIPTIVAFLINSIYSLADTFFVSGLGESATAAVGVNTALDQLIMMCGSMLAVGANSFIARLLGGNQEKKASQVLSTAFFLAFAIGTVLLIFGGIFMEPMVNLLGATDSCRAYAIDYATYMLLAAPFMATSFVMNQCLRSEGSATLSMIGMGFGGVLNCVLDPLFIFGTEGLRQKYGIDLPFAMPGMGVAGASLATAISKVVSFLILLFPYITRRSLLRLSIRNFRFTWEIIKEIVSVGSSSMFRSGLAVVSGILLNHIDGGISDGVMAAIGVVNKIMMFPFSIILGFGSGFQPVAGFNWGAKRYDRVLESYRFCSYVALIGGCIMAVVLIFLRAPIISVFADPETAQSGDMAYVGGLSILLQSVALPVHGWVAVVNMLCAGLGDAKGALALSTARQGSCMIPVLFPLAWIFGAGGVASVQAVADVLSLAIAVPIVIHTLRRVREAKALQERKQV